MDNNNPKSKEKIPPDKPKNPASVQKLPYSKCFCDELSISSNNFPCSFCALTFDNQRDNTLSDAVLNIPRDSKSSNSFFDVSDLTNIQDKRCESMEFQSSPIFLHKVDSSTTNDVNSHKRKRSNDIEVDLSKFSVQNKPLVNTHNRFSILGEIDIEEEQNILNKKDTNIKTTLVKDNGFCPPIFLFNVNIKHLIEQLNAKKIIFKIVNKNKHKSKLYLKDAAAHSEMMSLLRDKKIESYSYTPKELKRTSVVLRGLFYKSDLTEIKKEIDSLVPNTVDTVTKFSTFYTRRNNLETSLFLVTLLCGKNQKEVTGLRYLLNQRVYWESPKASLKEVQCWRCQKWGHISRNCNRPFKCVKCDVSHAPGDCKFVSSPENLPFCVNCKERGHPSNFKGCSEYKRYVSFRDNIKNSARENKEKSLNNVSDAINVSNFFHKDKTFASLLHNAVPKKSITPKKIPSYIQEFLKIAQSFCRPEPLTLKEKIEQFMKDYISMSREVAKNQCLSLMNEINLTYGP